MRVLTGTSGFSYTAWRGSFYPEKWPESKMLAFYAERLGAVEINNTFYRMPSAEALGKWSADTPAHFRFVLKSPRSITHEKKLADSGGALERLATAASSLGDKLGPVLFQLPPFLRKDVPRLTDFLAAMPAGLAPALEFRHTSWFADDVYEVLRGRGAALCVAESEEIATPFEATAGWGYLRLRRQDYDEAALAKWAEALKAKPYETAYVFFKHEDEGRGPALAAAFERMMI